jgi:hypothetical protein
VKNDVIGLISDLHAPYQHTDALDFIIRIKQVYKPNRWINTGDESDKHGISFHDSNSDLFSPGHELKEAIAFHKETYKHIKNMDLLESNHGSLHLRKALANGIPMGYFKSYNDIYGIPSTWRWHYDLTVKLPNRQNCYFHHGKSSDVFKLSQAMGMCAIQGHYHEKFNIHYWGNPLGLWWGMQIGCLIDHKSIAFAYNKCNLKRPILGTGIIIDSQPMLIPMVLNKRGRWIGRLV